MRVDLELVEMDNDPDRLQEWWIMSGQTRIAKFYDKQTATEEYRKMLHDSSYTSIKIQEAKNAKGKAIRAAVESATRAVGT